MRKKELIKQLHNLKKEIKPDQAWKKANQEILLTQIKSQSRLEFAQGQNKILAGLFKNNLFSVIYRPVGSIIIVLLIIFSSFIASVNATKNSLPGDLWYGVKLTSERVQVNLVFDDEKKANLEIEFAERRLDEIKEIMENNDNGKDQDLEVPLQKFQESMTNVKTSLVKLEKKDKKTALKLAGLVEEKSNQYVDLLEENQDDIPTIVVNTEDAISSSKATGDKALSLIIKEFEAEQSDLPFTEVLTRVSQRYEKIANNTQKSAIQLEIILNKKKVLNTKEAGEAEEVNSAEEEENLVEETEEAEEVNSAEEEDNTSTQGDQTASDSETEDENNDNDNEEENQEDEQEAEPAQPEVLTLEQAQQELAKVTEALKQAKGFIDQIAISQAFEQLKLADELLTNINKTIKANAAFLQGEDLNNQESKLEIPALEPVDPEEENPEADNLEPEESADSDTDSQAEAENTEESTG